MRKTRPNPSIERIEAGFARFRPPLNANYKGFSVCQAKNSRNEPQRVVDMRHTDAHRGRAMRSSVAGPDRATIHAQSAGSRCMQLTAVLTPAEEGGFVALNPETGTTTQGETVEEAVANLKEATALYLAEFPLPTSGPPVVTTFSVPEPAHA
jgi:predicted RNase H-like HicB family nuclease